MRRKQLPLLIHSLPVPEDPTTETRQPVAIADLDADSLLEAWLQSLRDAERQAERDAVGIRLQ